jgi:predicted MFS family arabinose efflux permease
MSYRRLLTRQMFAWAFTASMARLPVAMAPLAMVFLGRGTAGGYAIGSVLAAFFIAGEVVGAWVLGTMANPRRLRLHLAVGLAFGALAFTVLAVAHDASTPVLAAAAFAAGAAPAASPGGLRTVLSNMVEDRDVPRAFSVDSVLTELLWLAAPGLVVLLALWVGPSAPLALCAACLGLGAMSTLTLRRARRIEETSEHAERPATRVILSGWPSYLTSAAAMSLMAVSELVLPPLLEYRDLEVGLAGVVLMVFGGLSALGAFCYGLRSWPGTPRTQSLVCLLLTAAGITVMAVVPGLLGILLGFLPAGVFQAVVMVTRNLSLRERLPENAHTAGYSVMYSVQGIGYALSAVFAGLMLDRATPSAAILTGVAFTVLLGGASAIAEVGRRADLPDLPEPDAVR